MHRFTLSILLSFAAAISVLSAASPQVEPNPVTEQIKELGGRMRAISQTEPAAWSVEFHLTGRKLDDAGLAKAVATADIVSLNLRDTNITSAGLAHLKDELQLRRLHLERTAIDDKGSQHLAGLKNLEYLNLYGTHITNKTLEHLTGLKKLSHLYVWQTKVTDEGVAKLQKALPNLEIVRGVDLDQLPAHYAPEPQPEKPKAVLKWVATGDASEAPQSKTGDNVQVWFENKSEKNVRLYWVSYDNELKLYGVIKPQETRQQNTYSKNVWLVTDPQDKPLGRFEVGIEDALAIIPK